MIIRSVVLTLGLLAASSAFAQSGTAASDPQAPASRSDRTPAPSLATLEMERHCLRETGSHIRQRAGRDRPRCASYSAGRVYTREDIERTGQTDISDALRMLDPSVY